MSLTITVHRGSREIGGTCIEIRNGSGERLILDAGRPLDAPEGTNAEAPASLDRSLPASVLISHPHQDHWGVVSQLPASWPVWAGSKAAELIAVTGEVMGRPLGRQLETWHSRSHAFMIGEFRISPILTDHSAFDAYMLLVEGDDQRILYTGDFRRHGRKSVLVEGMMARPPAGVDVLIMEGTNLGADKPVRSERELERDFENSFRRTTGRVFVAWSAQNIDRTVTLYRAAVRARRTLVVDLYTADVLDRIASDTRLPRPGFAGLQVVLTRRLRDMYARAGREDFVDRMARRCGISAAELKGGTQVVMLRRALISDYQRKGVTPSDGDALIFSMWSGYRTEPYYSGMLDWFRTGGGREDEIHTSGHASPADLKAFAAAIRAKVLIPVHGKDWDAHAPGFENVKRLADGELYAVR
jgi:ribonuclease J